MAGWELLFVLETHLPIPSFFESPLTEQIETREGESKQIHQPTGLPFQCYRRSSSKQIHLGGYTSSSKQTSYHALNDGSITLSSFETLPLPL
ncbi:hypothetical protein RHGRI_008447 [Rhododendron griersonianum]|uniref:Uncharacterized protein n=1 Tax=Rhododendron griersonianum TaxID=479676 RepID=A0AAV6L2I0_9ERIC|nr:hypothetical protein RHGRI_008447 [Rhododendron griersonianum]